MCETDFVAKTDNFIKGLETVLDTLHAKTDIEIGQDKMKDQDYIQ